MSTLMDFLIENTGTDLTEEVVISDRLVDDQGEKIKFNIRALSTEEYNRIQKECTKISKKGATSFDQGKMIQQVILTCSLEPNFRDASAIQKAGVAAPEQLLNRLLLPGEQRNLYQAVSSLSGFDRDLDELKDEVKNS